MKPAKHANSGVGTPVAPTTRPGQRTYLFGRPYLAYVSIVRRFLSQMYKLGDAAWRWFKRRGGGPLVELGLPYVLIMSAVSLMHARSGFSLDQFLLDLVIGTLIWAGVLVLSLFSRWNAPAHVATGLILGSFAVIAGLVALLIATAFFTSYLAILLSVTALSLMVFLPLRLCHWLWLQMRKITYKCPYDDCRYRGLPIHICNCGAEYADLEPNFYGVFHHSCSHADGEVKLPTLFGRNALPRLCGGCHRPLLHSSLGELREWPIFIMGAPNAGKTVFLAQAVRQLLKMLAERPGSTVRLDSEIQQREHAEHVRLLDTGQVLVKTSGDVMTALGLAVRIPKGLRALVYLFDKPGEYFQSMRQFGKMQGIEGLKGIVLLVDPFSLPGLAENTHRLSGLLKPSETPFHTIAGYLIQVVEQMLHGGEQRQCDVPLAVVLSKADALPSGTHPFLGGLIISDHVDDSTALSNRCRDAINRLGGDASVRLLEQKFKNIRYFACTAMGRMPELRDATPFQPHGVEQPLLWLLGQAAPASAEATHTLIASQAR